MRNVPGDMDDTEAGRFLEENDQESRGTRTAKDHARGVAAAIEMFVASALLPEGEGKGRCLNEAMRQLRLRLEAALEK